MAEIIMDIFNLSHIMVLESQMGDEITETLEDLKEAIVKLERSQA